MSITLDLSDLDTKRESMAVQNALFRISESVNAQAALLIAVEDTLDEISESIPDIVSELRSLAEDFRVNSEHGEHRRISKIADSLENLLPPKD